MPNAEYRTEKAHRAALDLLGRLEPYGHDRIDDEHGHILADGYHAYRSGSIVVLETADGAAGAIKHDTTKAAEAALDLLKPTKSA